MFDNLNKQNNFNQGRQGLNVNSASAGPEDMFAEVDQTSSQTPQSQQVANDAHYDEFNSNMHKGNAQKVFVLLITLLGFVLLGAGLYFGYGYLLSKKNEISLKKDSAAVIQEQEQEQTQGQSQPQDQKQNDSQTDIPADSQNVATTVSEAISEPIADTDKDGIVDTEEAQRGTNVNSTDTDDDGLFDREEIKVYKTDPLARDTDSDGMSDGEEVKIGRNPNGDGFLYNVPSSSQKTQLDPLATPSQSSVADQPADNIIDSDNDGLSDEEEKKYKTNPHNGDSDSDGYSDASEIKNGYNPNGSGKLVL